MKLKKLKIWIFCNDNEHDHEHYHEHYHQNFDYLGVDKNFGPNFVTGFLLGETNLKICMKFVSIYIYKGNNR